jgi:hypothetical protein
MNDVHDMRTGGAMSIVVARGAGHPIIALCSE